jgi:hypothetical protein
MVLQLSKTLVEKLAKEPVKSFTSSDGSKKGDNVAGNLIALTIQTEAGKELNLIHKALPSDPFAKQFAVEQGTFRIENTFYAHFAPALEAWGKSRGLKSTTRDSILPIPKFVDGFNDDENDYVCMEDLRPKGYRMPDKYAGLTLEETSLVLKELGQYHALTFGFLQWEGEKIFDTPEFKIFNKDMLADDGMVKKGEGMFMSTYEMSVELVGQRDPVLAERMKKATPRTIQDSFSTMLNTDKKYFPVVILGDLWVNNVLFKYGPDGSPESVNFIDFQLSRRGNIYEELQYFIFTSTTPEFRKKHLSQVLDIYYDSFMSTIDTLKCNPPLKFTRGVFRDSFFENYMPAFIYMGFAIPMQLGTPMEFSGPPQQQPDGNTNGQSPPPEIPAEFSSPSAGGDVDPLDMQLKMMLMGLRMSMDGSPRAVDRLYAIASEMAALKVF